MWVEPNPTWGEDWTAVGPWTQEVTVGGPASPESEAGHGSFSATALAIQAVAIVNVGDSAVDSQQVWDVALIEFEPMARSGATTSFAYDATGNLDTKTGGWDYDWNPENLMTLAKLGAAQARRAFKMGYA